MQTTRSSWLIATIGLALPLLAAAAPGGTMEAPPTQMRELTPQEIARNAYNDGVRAVKQAAKYEKDVAKATKENKKAKAAERVRKQYEKARTYFAVAVSKQAAMHEAWNYIGYTSRKLGEYDKALTAYNEALRLKPDYAEAIEYRGVAYVTLNRMEEAKAAYMKLFGSNRTLANQLMQEMQHWIADRRSNPGGVASTDIDSFARWVDERLNIAQQTASLTSDAQSAKKEWRGWN